MLSKETLARGAVNAMPIIRAVAGPIIGEKIRKTPPEKRSKKLALAVGVVAATDFWDGFITKKYIGTSWFGKWADQIGDKIFARSIDKALVDTGEIPEYHYKANLARDIGVTGLRIYAEAKGMDTAAQPMGRLKACVDFLIKVAAASPLARHNTAINAGMDVSTGLSLVSGAGYAKSFLGGEK